ncbi:hypothetical protein GINT2_000643 [Glugoides intestinalis]
MDKFLELEPEFSKDAEVFEIIRKRIVFKRIKPLESSLTLVKLPLFKQLLESKFFNSLEIKKKYEEAVQREANEAEKMIFQLICGEDVFFKDIRLKFVFYKVFPRHKDLFHNKSDATAFILQDLLFRKVYFHEDVNAEMQELVRSSPFKQKIFYVLALQSYLEYEFLKHTIFKLKSTQLLIKQELFLTDVQFERYWCLALCSLPTSDLYAIITSELVYSPLVDKIRIFRATEDLIDQRKLIVCVMKECFSNDIHSLKFYIVFLKILEIASIPYEFKLKLFYSWLRYFLWKQRADLFFDLMKSIKKTKKYDGEFEFYIYIERYLQGDASLEELHSLSEKITDDDDIAQVSIQEVMKTLKRMNKYKMRG